MKDHPRAPSRSSSRAKRWEPLKTARAAQPSTSGGHLRREGRQHDLWDQPEKWRRSIKVVDGATKSVPFAFEAGHEPQLSVAPLQAEVQRPRWRRRAELAVWLWIASALDRNLRCTLSTRSRPRSLETRDLISKAARSPSSPSERTPVLGASHGSVAAVTPWRRCCRMRHCCSRTCAVVMIFH